MTERAAKRDPRKKTRKRGCERYAVQHNGVITTFGEKVLAALEWREANPGSILLSRYSGSLATHPWTPMSVIKISPEGIHAD